MHFSNEHNCEQLMAASAGNCFGERERKKKGHKKDNMPKIKLIHKGVQCSSETLQHCQKYNCFREEYRTQKDNMRKQNFNTNKAFIAPGKHQISARYIIALEREKKNARRCEMSKQNVIQIRRSVLQGRSKTLLWRGKTRTREMPKI